LIIGFVVLGTIISGLSGGSKEASRPDVVYNLVATASGIDENNIKLTGTTNLPDDSLLNVIVERIFVWQGESESRSFRIATSSTTVKNGAYDVQIKVDDKKFLDFQKVSSEVISNLDNNVRVTVTFDPTADNQPASIVKIVGAKGEKLESSPQKDVFGSLTNDPINHLNVELKTALPFPYSDQLPR
jgi:hypothetical protein